jgi:hypothetical protein
MLRYLSLNLLLSMIAVAPAICQEKPVGYVVEMRGEWHVAKTDSILAPSSLLMHQDELRLAQKPGDTAPMVHLRFYTGLCDDVYNCTPATPCAKPISVSARFAMLADECRVKSTTWATTISNAWLAFFGTRASSNPAIAITLSRGSDAGDDEGDDPVLQESVVNVKAGALDLGQLFQAVPAGAFSLQFCDPGPALDATCGDSAEKDRASVKISAGKPVLAALSKAEGLYRVRLWKMTPKGQQPTARNAIVLVCRNCDETQKTFEDLSLPARGLARKDPMIRMMLSAWLAEKAGVSAP